MVYQRPVYPRAFKSTTLFAAKIALFVFAFLIVIWTEAGFKFHFSETIHYLFVTSDYLTLAGIMIAGFLLGKLLEFLLMLTFHRFFNARSR